MVSAIAAFYLAYTEYETGNATAAQYAVEMPLFTQVQQEMTELSSLPVKHLLPADEAVEEIVGRLIDDTELMGSSVRLQVPGQSVTWEEVAHGVQRTELKLTTSAEEQAALGYLAILWQLLQRQPVRIKQATITTAEEAVTFDVALELLALTGSGG
jgi:hypothetical protein